jgi:tRNA threonylcarbamoyladenosine biosynthesis protein TsaE
LNREIHLALDLKSEAATEKLAAKIALTLADLQAAPFLMFLEGELGAGKTFFTRSLLHHLGFVGRVKSPTFTLMEPYYLPAFPVFHFDFYRFEGGSDWREAGFEEYLPGDGVAIVEWPKNAVGLPTADLELSLVYGAAADTRIASFTANSSKAKAVLESLAFTMKETMHP